MFERVVVSLSFLCAVATCFYFSTLRVEKPLPDIIFESKTPRLTDPGLYKQSRSVGVEEAQGYVELLLINYTSVAPEVSSLSCQRGACTVNGALEGEAERRSLHFLESAQSRQVVSDKVTVHRYETMYGTFLLPKMNRPGAKFLEIGLGCGMSYGPGASVALWQLLFWSDAEIWEAEYDTRCVAYGRWRRRWPGIHIITGDQGDRPTVEAWVRETGGQFDVVIDDGGHRNNQILNSFEVLWPTVKPGGLYFLEDLQVGRMPPYDSVSRIVIADLVAGWIQQLVERRLSDSWPLPQNVSAIFCQREACVLQKAYVGDRRA